MTQFFLNDQQKIKKGGEKQGQIHEAPYAFPEIRPLILKCEILCIFPL